MEYQPALLTDRYAQAALSIAGLAQPRLSDVADALMRADVARFASKGKWMSADHLKQEARRINAY